MNVELLRNFLLSKGLVTDNLIDYCMRCVVAFLQFCRLQDSESFSDRQVDEYIDSIANRRLQCQWDRAREAISLILFSQSKKNMSGANPIQVFRMGLGGCK